MSHSAEHEQAHFHAQQASTQHNSLAQQLRTTRWGQETERECAAAALNTAYAQGSFACLQQACMLKPEQGSMQMLASTFESLTKSPTKACMAR